MNYIYDILLNFNKENRIYDFYEWNDDDFIINVKKAPVFRVKPETLHDFYDFRVKVSNDFLKRIENNSSVYKKGKSGFPYLAIFTDGNVALGINFNSKGISINRSFLLFEEEDEVLSLTFDVTLLDLEYKKLDRMGDNLLLTRKQREEKEYLKKEFSRLFKAGEENKLRYLYVEYFGKKEDDVNKIYTSLISSLNDINNKHSELYQLLKYTCKK